MRLGVFGGTFNPPHLAHKYLALQAAAAANLDRVLIIPDATPPHKIAKDLVSGEDRLELCRRTFSSPLFDVSDMELRRSRKSYTIDTLREIKETLRPDELFLIIGSDMLLSFHQWREYQAILSLCRLIVLSRETAISVSDLAAYAQDVLGLAERRGEILLLSVPTQELSSTEIRRRLAAGAPVDGLLEPDAIAYIIEKGLYQ